MSDGQYVVADEHVVRGKLTSICEDDLRDGLRFRVDDELVDDPEHAPLGVAHGPPANVVFLAIQLPGREPRKSA
jgi:hypothetical protein